LEHTYADDEVEEEDDVYVVKVKLVDDDTGEIADEHEVSVSNVAPVVGATLDRTAILEGETVRLGIDITDPGTDDSFTITIDWADGAELLVYEGVTMDTLPGFIEHTYLDDEPSGTPSDTLSIRITVEDADGDAV